MIFTFKLHFIEFKNKLSNCRDFANKYPAIKQENCPINFLRFTIIAKLIVHLFCRTNAGEAPYSRAASIIAYLNYSKLYKC